jgi:LmbE family N-acetylglucosaminyl deacetylase
MSLKQSLLSAFRVMNFLASERAWRTLSVEADFKVVQEIPKSNIFVIAPHPDDEIFGCSGALSNLEKDQKAQIAYIFSGDDSPKSKHAEEREEESKEAVRLLTNPEQIFFRQSDNSVVGKRAISELSEIIIELGEGMIFVPSFSDANIDHRESVRVISEALKIAGIKGLNLKNVSIWLYEIWSPLPYFNRLLELDWSQKQKSMEKFKTQLKDRNYIKAIKALNEYRGEMYGLKKPAEAFFAIPADIFLKNYIEK